MSKLIVGRIVFPDGEELLEFQYKFLILLQIFASSTSLLFLWLVHIGVSPRFSELHMQVMMGYSIVSIGLWLALRGRKKWFLPIAWTFEVASLIDLFSAFIFVNNDELRILWLFTNIPGAYLVLGRRVGALMTGVIVVGFVVINPYVAQPYSPNAVATGIVAMLYFAVFFDAYSKRAVSFFTRMRESNARLHEMATRDMLTGVLNARAYYEICDSMIKLAKRHASSYAVLFVDLDHFKSINDTHGHAAGDAVLKAVAGCLSLSIRSSDSLGRIGGEEFSIFLPKTDASGAKDLAETIRRNIEGLMPAIGDQSLRVTASIGVAAMQHHGQSMQEIQRQADQAMYLAKSAGRNRVSSLDGATA